MIGTLTGLSVELACLLITILKEYAMAMFYINNSCSKALDFEHNYHIHSLDLYFIYAF